MTARPLGPRSSEQRHRILLSVARTGGTRNRMDAARTGKITLTEAERADLAWLKAQSSSHDGACVEIARAPT